MRTHDADDYPPIEGMTLRAVANGGRAPAEQYDIT